MDNAKSKVALLLIIVCLLFSSVPFPASDKYTATSATETLIFDCEPQDGVSSSSFHATTDSFWLASKFVIPVGVTSLTKAYAGCWFTIFFGSAYYYYNVGFSETLTTDKNSWAVCINDGSYGWGGGEWSWRKGLHDVDIPVSEGQTWYFICEYVSYGGSSADYVFADGETHAVVLNIIKKMTIQVGIL